MSVSDVIEKALLQNSICKSDIAVVTTEKHHYLIHIFELIVLLLCNFSLMSEMSSTNVFNLLMSNFEEVIHIILIEIQSSVLQFDNLYEEDKEIDVVEFHNKDECILVVAIQDKVNKKLKELIEREM